MYVDIPNPYPPFVIHKISQNISIILHSVTTKRESKKITRPLQTSLWPGSVVDTTCTHELTCWQQWLPAMATCRQCGNNNKAKIACFRGFRSYKVVKLGCTSLHMSLWSCRRWQKGFKSQVFVYTPHWKLLDMPASAMLSVSSLAAFCFAIAHWPWAYIGLQGRPPAVGSVPWRRGQAIIGWGQKMETGVGSIFFLFYHLYLLR